MVEPAEYSITYEIDHSKITNYSSLPTSVKAGESVTIPVINFNDMPLAHIVAYINGVEVKRVNQSESLIIDNVNGDIVIRNEA